MAYEEGGGAIIPLPLISHRAKLMVDRIGCQKERIHGLFYKHKKNLEITSVAVSLEEKRKKKLMKKTFCIIFLSYVMNK